MGSHPCLVKKGLQVFAMKVTVKPTSENFVNVRHVRVPITLALPAQAILSSDVSHIQTTLTS